MNPKEIQFILSKQSGPRITQKEGSEMMNGRIEKIKLFAFLTLVIFFSFCMALRAEYVPGKCTPAVLNVLQKLASPHTYEVRDGAWPGVLTTQGDLAHAGTNVIFVKKIGSRVLPTNNGFSQSYIVLEQCVPQKGTWGQ